MLRGAILIRRGGPVLLQSVSVSTSFGFTPLPDFVSAKETWDGLEGRVRHGKDGI